VSGHAIHILPRLAMLSVQFYSKKHEKIKQYDRSQDSYEDQEIRGANSVQQNKKGDGLSHASRNKTQAGEYCTKS
jgi:hypothetical protein